ncbi:MAG: hypothetical protein RI591_00735 [Dehalococcoidia bacterium]|nr:hypothetical protein [Dehalococcoidia bacterium]
MSVRELLMITMVDVMSRWCGKAKAKKVTANGRNIVKVVNTRIQLRIASFCAGIATL